MRAELIEAIDALADVLLLEDGEWVTMAGGQHIMIGGKDSDRVARARASQNFCRADKQRIADKSEARLAEALGVPQTPDNAPFDLRNDDIGIEVKTLIDQKNDKITMSKAALGRKLAEMRAEGIKPFTVVRDLRSGTAKYYVSDRLGSLRLGSMQSASLSEIRAMVRGAI